MNRNLSLVTPSGRLTLGNYLGAFRGMVASQDPAIDRADCFYGVSDLHAMTTAHDPRVLRDTIAEVMTVFLAVGLDPDRAVLFRQSAVPAHRELAYLLECTAYTGELVRMIQYKEKGKGQPSTRVSLYTYPVLMAADILLYRPTRVPVGNDQRQHVELTRDLATRFNNAYGAVFTVPEIVTPAAGARVMDLQEPARKMSKSAAPGADGGVIRLLDPPDVVRRKVARAVTDSDTGPDAVRSAGHKAGVTNLLDVLAACGGSAEGITTYGALKAAVTDAAVSVLEPIQKRYADLAGDPAYVAQVFDAGSARCREVTAPVLAAAEAAIGL
ncbi:tryptophan--tRNA ligase [Nocardioides agariphilus]|jgi:tryptophanyl-tRNA synthetase|uniref:Tryptophan--tRNA ligase n=1 Tax=Nocardioides agariphilus TaxID=433664 RepID=A0A930VNX2_9ACTN|nr:tryptophan--tRNA ligase [Nocardioides agariphilus]MBF4768215.1 tryptophan--tRNA ligase [Nocardioides agariphilus]